MKIAIVQATWTPHSRARVAATRARVDGDHQVEIVTLAGTQSDYEWPNDDVSSDEALFPQDDYLMLAGRRVRRAVSAALDAADPDVIVLPGWDFKESLSGLGWAIRSGTPRVVVSDSQRIDSDRTWLRERIKRSLIVGFDAAFVAGTRHITYLAELGLRPELCFVGCDVVDNDHFARRRPARGEDGSPVMLSCIRLLPRKNAEMVLAALAEEPGWRWRIAGDGPSRLDIERSIDRLGLADRVELVGHVDYADLPATYRAADVYLQPSLSEPWGLAVNEAMASGLPVLVSDRCGCAPDLVRPGENGFTFDPVAPESLRERLRSMLDARGRWDEMGEASRRIIASWDLDLYATNVARACEAARSTGPSRSLSTRALGLLLR